LSTQIEPKLAQLVAEVWANFEATLFKQAERARNNAEQTRLLEGLRIAGAERSRVLGAFMARVKADLQRIELTPLADAAEPGNSPAEDLALVDTQRFEEDLALKDLGGRATVRYSEIIHLLGQRFAVLVGAPAFEPEQVPLAPDRLAAALREATDDFAVPAEQRLALFAECERLFLVELGTIYEEVDRIFVAARILPNAQGGVRRISAAGTNQSAAAKSRPPANPTGAPAPAAESTQNPPAPTPTLVSAPEATPRRWDASAAPMSASADSGAARAWRPSDWLMPGALGGDRTSSPSQQPPSISAADLSRFPGLAGLLAPMTGWPALGASEPRTGPEVADEVRLIDSIVDLLQQRRQALGPPQPGMATQVDAPTVDQALAELQRLHASERRLPGGAELDHGELKQELLGQLRAHVPPGRTPVLANQAEGTIDLIGMLLSELVKGQDPASPIRDLLARLKLPLLRVGLQDRSFFTTSEHPARRFLDTVADSGLYWINQQGPDSLLFERLRAMVDRIAQDFSGDLGLFNDQLEDLRGFMTTLARKADVAETRHIETAKGRERLEYAKQSAQRAIVHLLDGRRPPALVRALLEQTWTDVLALSILRHGDDKTELERRLRTANQLTSFFEARDANGTALAPAELSDDLIQGLATVGFHAKDARQLVDRLLNTDDGASSELPTSSTEIAIKLKSRPRLGAESGTQPTAALPKAEAKSAAEPAAALSEEQRRIRQHLLQTPFGTWFEFVDADGRPQRLKLAWFSTVSGRCLFVNARGARVEDVSIDELARRVAAGTAAIVGQNMQQPITSAWRRVLGSLKSLGGSAQPKTEADLSA